MRILAVLLLAALAGGCLSADLDARAQVRLGRRSKHIYSGGHDRIGDRDVYVFCRDERATSLGLPFAKARRYDSACVMYLCAPGATADRCEESMM